MEIYQFIEKNFELLKTVQGWLLVCFGAILGFATYHLLHSSELREIQLKSDRVEAVAKQQSLTSAELTPLQKVFLEKLMDYQDKNNLTKVVISHVGRIFDDAKSTMTGTNVIEAFLGKNTESFSENDLESLIYGIPEQYLKMIPEMRFDSPYVLTVTPIARSLFK